MLMSPLLLSPSCRHPIVLPTPLPPSQLFAAITLDLGQWRRTSILPLMIMKRRLQSWLSGMRSSNFRSASDQIARSDGCILFEILITMALELPNRSEAIFSANAAALASRKSSPRVTKEAVQKAAVGLNGSDHRRATTVSARLDAQQKKVNLHVLPTTTIGSFAIAHPW